ncbi:CASP-like protein 5C3 [Lycium ferocissimum]|uniref:CASP-like protein 5C3 n=1 Tax=Lycium ferocissimum TaxID=112874 RepID=UPI0028160F47|nr:CASP-like protein 5C3 [Lycium ferocissimum]XP_059293737.1 CASP-like protein 5C3 [Lycium ferocissimum]
MDELPGTMGTSASLALRFGQCLFSIASLLFMFLGVPFYSFSALCFMMTVMGLVMAWSLTLVMVDVFSVLIQRPYHQPGIISVVVLGDWVLSFLSLAASCSTASVAEYLIRSSSPNCSGNLCTRYQLSACMGFFAWFLTLASALFHLWLLPKLYPEE